MPQFYKIFLMGVLAKPGSAIRAFLSSFVSSLWRRVSEILDNESIVSSVFEDLRVVCGGRGFFTNIR